MGNDRLSGNQVGTGTGWKFVGTGRSLSQIFFSYAEIAKKKFFMQSAKQLKISVSPLHSNEEQCGMLC